MSEYRAHITARTTEFPREVLNRAKKMGAHFHMHVAQIIRDGTVLRIEQLEAKKREEAALEATENEEKDRRGRKLRGLHDGPGRPLAALSAIMSPINATIPTVGRPDRLEEIYVSYAKKILVVMGNEIEMRLLAEQAVAAIRRERPLSSPPQHDILSILESHILRLQEENVADTRTYDSMVNKVIDVSKMKTKDRGIVSDE